MNKKIGKAKKSFVQKMRQDLSYSLSIKLVFMLSSSQKKEKFHVEDIELFVSLC